MAERALRHAKIQVFWNTVIDDVLGDTSVAGLAAARCQEGHGARVKVDGLFVAIGHTPNTELFRGQVELDEKGYVVLKKHTMKSVPGRLRRGGRPRSRYRQAVTAAGWGCMAAMDAEKYLEGH